MEQESYIYRFALMCYLPKRNLHSIGKLFHTPGAFETTCHKMHWDKQTCLELLYELSCTTGIAITYAAIYRKQHNIKAISHFSDVLEFTQILLLVFLRVYLAKLKASDGSTLIVGSQEPGVPIIQIACMKDTLACNFYYPRHTAIITTGCNYLYIFVAP